jgi:alpha-beta hydrolase superfamily lysophospholipase
LTLAAATNAYALPEASMNTHGDGAIPKQIEAAKGNLVALQEQLAKTGVPQLDALWASRKDFHQITLPDATTRVLSGLCGPTDVNCRVLSVFHGPSNSRPVVLMPGFTGYRKMYLEQIYDLLNEGFGPIYISDFTGTGDSYKPELKVGQSEPTIAQFDNLPLNKAQGVGALLDQKIMSVVGHDIFADTKQMITQLPIGIGYIKDFKTYNKDVDFIMNQAVLENPKAHNIMIHTLSMSGLCLMLALIDQDSNPTWITHVGRIVTESPMIRVKATGLGGISDFIATFGAIGIGPTQVVGAQKAIPEFGDKALGNYNADNLISHSKPRLTLTDGMRVWNGHETTGATLGWVSTELRYQYALNLFDVGLDPLIPEPDPLNNHMEALQDVLAKNHIVYIDVSSMQDPVVDTSATQDFLNHLKGKSEIHFCTLEDSRHVIDQESDLYRVPYMQLLLDQQKNHVSDTYGTAPQNQIMECVNLTSDTEAIRP